MVIKHQYQCQKKDKSSFLITKGLSSLDLSFITLLLPNFYLRHEDGRIKLAKNDQTDLFKQDSTFKLIFDYQRDLFCISNY